MRAFEELGEKYVELDSATSKRLFRRIDLLIMCECCITLAF